jgi:NADPH:quinone reductase-like Zn-dependent oxidoreductase
MKKGGKCVSIAATPTTEGIFPTEEELKSGVREPISSPTMLSTALAVMSAKVRFSAWSLGVSYSYLLVRPSREDLQKMAEWMLEKKLIVHIQKKYRFNQTNEALEELEKGGVIGKLVIDVTDDN